MSASVMNITVRRDNRTVASATMSKGCEPVLIGRSSQCALRLPSDDKSASSLHAKLFWKGSSLMIEDAGSRNGIFRDGRPIRRAEKVAFGALYAIGGSLLSVQDVAKVKTKVRNASKYHRLEFMNGENAGTMVDIVRRQDGKDFDIGLDPKCSVHLGDMLVSRRHAVLKVNEAGECWIEDLGSRNGTFVNGERLSGKERLLRDGDVIAIAFFEFRFLDRSVSHTRLQLWYKLGVIAITGCVMAMGYIAYIASRQSVNTYLAEARQNVARGDFAKARESVMASRSARDSSEYRQQIDALDNQIGIWEKTRDAWNAVKKNIASGQLSTARSVLDGLVSGPVEAWGWNPATMAATKKEADIAARALHLYFDGKDIVEEAGNDARTDSDVRVRALIGPIESFLREHGVVSDENKYLTGVMKEVESLLSDLRVIRSGYDKIDESIRKISAKAPDFRAVYGEFDRIAGSDRQSSAVRSYARQQLAICHAFVAAQDFVDAEFAKLLKLDFVGVRAMSEDIRLPSQELCIRNVRYSDARAVFLDQHQQLQKESESIQLMVEGLRSAGVTDSQMGDDIAMFFNTNNVIKALHFDCLRTRPPNARRITPSGAYDTLFGIEYTYESLQALPNAFNGRNIRAMGFSPRCVAARQAFSRVEAFVQYLDGEDRKHLQRGLLGRYYTQCVKILIERENFVQWLKRLSGSERVGIVANFYADYFAPRPSDVAKRLLRERFAKLRREMMTLSDRYTLETDPMKQLAIRDEIMAKGIPGDPVLHVKWAQKFD